MIRQLSYAMVLSLTGLLAAPVVSQLTGADVALAKGGAPEAVHRVKPGEVPHPHPAVPAAIPATPPDGATKGAGVDAPAPAAPADAPAAKPAKPAKAPKAAKPAKAKKAPAAAAPAAAPADVHPAGAPDALHPVRQGGALPGAQ